MDKSVVGLLGGVSALALIGCAQSALAKPVVTLQPAQSYAELLDPIPNAAELLCEVDRRPGFVEAQLYSQDGQPYYHHHHHHHYHHHHHSFYNGFIPNQDYHRHYHHHHHHHHHHHQQFIIPLPGY